MQTLTKPKVKLKVASCGYPKYQIKEKENNSRFDFDAKFQQKLFMVILASCVFLIFPESPQDSEAICKQYNPSAACVVW